MKKAIIIVVLFSVSSLVAQTKIAIKINSGLNVPMATKYFSDYWGASYNFGGGVDIYLDSQLSLGGYLDYNHFAFDGQKVLVDLRDQSGASISGSAMNILHLSANVKYHFIDIRQQVSPYVVGGIGFANLSLSDFVATNNRGSTSTLTAESVSGFSISFGGGVEFMISSAISIFVDARFVIGFTEGKVVPYRSNGISGVRNTGAYALTENTKYIPLRAGISFGL